MWMGLYRQEGSMKKPTKQILSLALTGLMLFLAPQGALAEEVSPEEDVFLAEEAEKESSEPERKEELPELSEKVSGMPEDYVPDEEELSEKAKMAEHYGAPDAFDDLKEDIDYAENEIWFLSDTKEYAETVARAYGGTLESFELGVATVRLDPNILSVEEAVRLGADPGSSFPVVSPNFKIYLEEPAEAEIAEEETEISVDSPVVGDGRLRYGWTEWYEDALSSGVKVDPALYPNERNTEGASAYQWMHDAIHTWAAWTEAPNLGSGVKVAVIDTNVLDTHEDLKGHATADRTVKPNWYDDSGHGTHVAGIIAGSQGNGLGGAGIAPKASIFGIPIFEKDEKTGKTICWNADIAKGMNRAIDEKVDIINLSLGGPGYDAELEEAFRNAYQAGITVVCAMGNEKSNSRQYPAAYEDYVVAVSAVDESGTKSGYSNYGEWADIAAPGDDIYSSCVSGTSEDSSYSSTYNVYENMSGTSMATPVISGVCALYMGEKGHVSPDEMLRVLKANVSGAAYAKKAKIGAGTIDLTNLFAVDELEAPELYADDVRIEGEANIGRNTVLSFRSEEETDSFLYSLNGKSPAVKNGVLTSGKRVKAVKNGNVYEASISVAELLENGEIEPGKKIVIKAEAVLCGGAIGKEGTWTVKAGSEESGVLRVEVTGQAGISPGKSATYKAALLPKNLKNKTVTWSLEGAPEGVSISKSGAVKVGKNVETGISFRVIAAAAANPEVSGVKSVTILEPVSAVTLTAEGITETAELTDYREHVFIPAYKKGVLQSVRLFTVNIPDEYVTVNGKTILNDTSENILKLSVNAGDGTHGYSYKSSNTKVATVNAEGIVTAVSEGKATITCTADDSGKKKASVAVNVIVPSSGIYLKAEDDRWAIGAGKTAKLEAVLGNAYGTPTLKKVNWDYMAYGAWNGADDKTDITDTVKKNRHAAISNGKLSAGQKLKNDNIYPYDDVILVPKAVTMDGTGSIDETGKFVPAQAGTTFWVYMATKKVLVYGSEGEVKNSVTMDTGSENVSFKIVPIFTVGRWQYCNDLTDFAVTSTNPGVASASASDDELWIAPEKPGKTVIKVRALDGSNVTKSFTVYVK